MNKETHIGVIGLGYVGLPLARLFSTKYATVGFDVDAARVETLMSGHDATLQVSDDQLRTAIGSGRFRCTTNPDELRACNFYVVTVPTPVNPNNHPDLTPLLKASETVGRVISKGDIVVYESTVYPGVTEEECLPAVERVSGLTFNVDFFAGYSPERINPGDNAHSVESIKKVTSGSTPAIADHIDKVYNSVLTNGTHKAPSIKVAEASKIIENSQRDVNIAFMNELAKIFNAMEIDTHDVISFDIFDTLLLRPFWEPASVFKYIEQKYHASDFLNIRGAMERNVRFVNSLRHKEQEDITYDMIYDKMPEQYKYLKDIELETEKKTLVANPEMKEIFDYAVKLGKKIIITSDMYLTREVLEQFLKSKGFDGFFKLYVSSEVRKCKHSGKE